MPDLPQRKSPRLKDYDYRQDGMYFITICTDKRQNLFGTVTELTMMVNNLGKLATVELEAIPQHRPYVLIESFIVMPNHVHAIVVLNHMNKTITPTPPNTNAKSLSAVIGSYKAAVSRQAKRENLLPQAYQLWQPSFHDHIIRNEAEHQTIYQYVDTNPWRWKEDRFYNA
jgi:putative transposase